MCYSSMGAQESAQSAWHSSMPPVGHINMPPAAMMGSAAWHCSVPAVGHTSMPSAEQDTALEEARKQQAAAEKSQTSVFTLAHKHA